MNRFIVSLFSILIFSCGTAFAAFSSISISTISCSVTFASTGPVPGVTINHTALTTIATDFAVISGTATSNPAGLDKIVIYYYQPDISVSSRAFNLDGSSTTYIFVSTSPVDRSKSYFYYKIQAFSGALSANWPSDGSYYSVDIQGPRIYHKQITNISAIDRVVVATGTATDSTIGLQTISMFYWTDNDTLKVTTETITGSYKSYDFRLSASAKAGASLFYYRLKAVNKNSETIETSTYTVTVTSNITQSVGTSGGTVTFHNGDQSRGSTSLVIPQGALSETAAINIAEVSPDDSSVPGNGRPFAVFRFSPAGLKFNKNCTLTISYDDTNISNIQELQLKIMWWDGFDWRLVGGTVNITANTVTAEIWHFSLYALFPVAAISDDDYRPKEKIITPATADGINDCAVFGGLVSGDTVKIFDIKGKKIKELTDNFTWYGTDDSGDIVESGIYIYQIKAGGKRISGVIAVAK